MDVYILKKLHSILTSRTLNSKICIHLSDKSHLPGTSNSKVGDYTDFLDNLDQTYYLSDWVLDPHQPNNFNFTYSVIKQSSKHQACRE